MVWVNVETLLDYLGSTIQKIITNSYFVLKNVILVVIAFSTLDYM